MGANTAPQKGEEAEIEEEDEEPLTIDANDCIMLCTHLDKKLEALEDAEVESEALLEAWSQDHGSDPRVGFIRAYRTGQRRILTEAVSALEAAVEGNEDNEDSEDDGNVEDS
jgi:hypothetical protein